MTRPLWLWPLVAALHGWLSPRVEAQGCFISGFGPTSNHPLIIVASTGNYQIDGQLNSIFSHLRTAFEVSPDLKLYVDDGSPNALAAPFVINQGGPDGTVLFGRTLMRREVQKDQMRHPGSQTFAVAAIMAHEFTHIVQMNRHITFPAPKERELEADYMAGWFMKHATLEGITVNLSDGMRAFYEAGDGNFFSPQHHGTPSERLAAFLAGVGVGSESFSQAFAAADSYVRTGGHIAVNKPAVPNPRQGLSRTDSSLTKPSRVKQGDNPTHVASVHGQIANFSEWIMVGSPPGEAFHLTAVVNGSSVRMSGPRGHNTTEDDVLDGAFDGTVYEGRYLGAVGLINKSCDLSEFDDAPGTFHFEFDSGGVLSGTIQVAKATPRGDDRHSCDVEDSAGPVYQVRLRLTHS